MELERCYKILELDRNASPDEVKRAYKDIAAVWHPDRFAGNPRLKRKAEEKLKEINTAYEVVKSHLSTPHQRTFNPEKRQSPDSGTKGDDKKGAPARQDKTEAFFEAGTVAVLGLWSYLSSSFRRVVEEARAGLNNDEKKR